MHHPSLYRRDPGYIADLTGDGIRCALQLCEHVGKTVGRVILRLRQQKRTVRAHHRDIRSHSAGNYESHGDKLPTQVKEVTKDLCDREVSWRLTNSDRQEMPW